MYLIFVWFALSLNKVFGEKKELVEILVSVAFLLHLSICLTLLVK